MLFKENFNLTKNKSIKMSRRLTQYIIRPQPSCAFETGRLAECQYKIG